MVALAASALLLACSPKVAEHGRPDLLVRAGDIIPAQTTEREVEQMLGTPAARSQFGERTWYYFGSQMETVAFLEPEITSQEALRITFDEMGTVKEVQHYNEDQAEDIQISERVTPTAGQKLGFFEQLLGNIGRFNKKQDALSTGSRLPGGG